MEEQKDIHINKPQKKLVWGLIPEFFWNLIKYIVIFVILLLMGVYYLIQIPSFQNYAKKKPQHFLSAELHAEVSVGRIRITFFQSLLLEDLLVKDRQNDTLLMTSQIKVGLKGGLFDLIDGKIDIQNVAIKTMKVRLIQNCPEYDNNYQFLINYIENGNPDSLFSKPSGKPNNIHLSIKDIDLKNVDVTMQNKYQGN
ncbi:MAG: hypothetical protein IPO33_02840 [Saprospiraceae bacterium]|nr:hypothetical protein [Candidatus Brachybacter algidus]